MDDIFIICGSSVSYQVIAWELGRVLADQFNVKIIDCKYKGEYHTEPFAVIPSNYKYMPAHINYLYDAIKAKHIIFVFDIIKHLKLEQAQQEREWEYTAIFPIESGPLSPEWTEQAQLIERRFVISQFGVKACDDASLGVTFLPLGVDTKFWLPGDKEEARRNCLQFWLEVEIAKLPDCVQDLDWLISSKIVLTVADNQERKNLPACFEIFAQLEDKKSLLVIIAPEQPHGWELYALAEDFQCDDRFVWLENVSREILREHYRAADVFLLPSQAEGYGLILREASACGLPWVATDCTAISEAKGGILTEPIMETIFPWGNTRRYWIDTKKAARAIERIFNGELLDIPTEWPTWEDCTAVLID